MFQNSLGLWVVHDGTKYYYFEKKSDAERFETGMTLSENPIEVEFAEKIVKEILPSLRENYLKMVSLQVQWQMPDFQEALTKSLESGTTLAGFNPKTWTMWGGLMMLLQAWMKTPQESLGGLTPESVLLKRYFVEGE